MQKPPKHLSSEEFKQAGYALIDWLAHYQENIEQYPVLSQVKPGHIKQQLPMQPPEEGTPLLQDMPALLSDLERIILPGVTHWQSPNFFAYFPANASGPSILGELLSAGLGVQGMLWATSPACTELETQMLDWLVTMLDLPQHFLSTESGGGVIQDTASSAALCALVAAREQTTEYQSNNQGINKKLVAYTSNQAHSSIEKAIRIAGIGSQQLRLVAVDEQFALSVPALLDAIDKDIDSGYTPFFISATLGTTSSTALDAIADIGKISKKYGMWLHVDAAHAGSASICPEFRFMNHGLEYADSYCFNPHKWLLTNFDCNCFFVKQRDTLIKALTILPEYLRNQASESGEVFDYRDWQVPLGRRFRALKLWLVIRHYGVNGLRAHIRHHVDLAKWFAQQVMDSDQFELAVEPHFNLVCFRYQGSNEANERLLTAINHDGSLYLTHTKLNEQYVLRFAVGAVYTEFKHVKNAWQAILKAVDKIAH